MHTRRVHASDDDVFAAIEAVTPRELPLFRTLMRLRGLGRSSLGRELDTPFFAQLARQGFTVLSRDPPHGLVLGLVGKPWRGEVGRADDFGAFAEPGAVRVATDVAVANGRLRTETRIVATDAAARRRFRAYWLVIRPGSGLIRREWLRAIARRADSSRQTRA